MFKIIKEDYLPIRLFIAVVIATAIIGTFGCTPKRPTNIVEHISTSTMDTLPQNTDIAMPATSTIDSSMLTPKQQITAIADSLQSSVKTATTTVTTVMSNPTSISPKSDIEDDLLKYQYVGGKFTNSSVKITESITSNDFCIEEGSNNNCYQKLVPITVTKGNKFRTETFVMTDITGNKFPVAVFYRGDTESPFAVRLPKRSLFNRMPTKTELAMVQKNSTATANCKCTSFHKVESGTTAAGIAAYRKTTVEALKKANPGINITVLKAGSTLCLKRACK